MIKNNLSKRIQFAILVALLFPIGQPVRTQPIEKPPGSKTIIVQKGETLSIISKNHLSDPSRWRELLKYNNIPNPNLIKPGMELVIPAYLSKAPIATTSFVMGKVEWKGSDAGPWNSLKLAHPLYPSDTIRTSVKSKADLTVDGSGLVRVHENSVVEILGLKSDKDPPSVFLKKGSIDSFISKLFHNGKPRAGEKLYIFTPSALAAVRGTEFRVELDPKENSTISCFDGEVSVTAENQTVELNKGYATFVEKGKPPGKPFEIPNPPKIQKEP
jgi:hypothetical protein